MYPLTWGLKARPISGVIHTLSLNLREEERSAAVEKVKKSLPMLPTSRATKVEGELSDTHSTSDFNKGMEENQV